MTVAGRIASPATKLPATSNCRSTYIPETCSPWRAPARITTAWRRTTTGRSPAGRRGRGGSPAKLCAGRRSPIYCRASAAERFRCANVRSATVSAPKSSSRGGSFSRCIRPFQHRLTRCAATTSFFGSPHRATIAQSSRRIRPGPAHTAAPSQRPAHGGRSPRPGSRTPG